MTSSKTTKRALLMSVISLLLCCSMLVGTTFAWFTDEVRSMNNVITAGNLDVEVTQNDTDIRQIELFKDILWEPGVVAYENITVENVGTLALQYDLFINFGEQNYVMDAEGNLTEYDLSDVLQVAIVPKGVTENNRDTLTGSITDWALLTELKAEGKLYPVNNEDQYDTEETFGIVIWWQPSADDNNWNVQNGKTTDDGKPLHINLGVNVYAQQLTYEEDSFGDDYDELPDLWDGTADFALFGLPGNASDEEIKDANLTEDEYEIKTAEELAAFAKLVDAGKTFEGKTVKLGANLDLSNKLFEPIGSYRKETAFMGTFDGQGHTICNLSQNTWELNNGYYYGDLGLGLFGKVEDATIKNLNIDGAEISGESAICGTVAAAAYGDCVFENITVSNANVADYQYYAGGIVGWASGDHQYINCDVDASVVIAGQWGDFDNSNGGVIGGCGGSATIYLKDCDIACRIDAYNDVTSSYQWYAYRRSGMIIGNTGMTVSEDRTTYAAAPQLTCENVTVTYGEWANYTYCEFAGTSWPYVRVQAGVSNSAYSNPRYGHPTDANGNEVVDDNHVHNAGEDHHILCVFDQLYGGGQGVYGYPTHDGVTVIYNNK